MSEALTVHVRILRNFTVEPLLPLLAAEFAARGLAAGCTLGDFAGAWSGVGSLASDMPADGRPRMLVLSLSIELYSEDFGHAGWNAGEACADVLALANAAVAGSPAPVVINTVLPPLHPETGFAVRPGAVTHAESVEALNLELRRLAARHPGRVVLLDWVAYARELGERDTYDRRFWHSSALPFSMKFLRRYATDLAAVAEALCGRARKCLVLDCDNTLWGGVVGEDGLEGIGLSRTGKPGTYFREFQRVVLDLHERGVLLALCSKNNEADVFEVFDRHPDTVLRREHFSAHRINWSDKAASIAQIAQALHISLDALVFVDDSPQEIERVRQALPMVRVLQTPRDPEQLPVFLQRAVAFPAIAITASDATRAQSFRDEEQRVELAALAGGLDDYRQRLGTVLRAREATASDLDRISQLYLKTNQFNLTTRRHDRVAVDAFAADPDVLLYCAEVSDKFGDLGLVAVGRAVRRGDAVHIEDFLLSCRALGRDAERAFLASLLRAAAARWGSGRVVASYRPSDRNAQVAGFWPAAGLAPAGPEGEGVARFESHDLPSLVERNTIPHIEERN